MWLVGFDSYYLSKDGKIINAVLSKKLDDSHNQVVYSYQVSNLTYEGRDIPFQELGSLKIGQNIEIIYSQSKPYLSCICVPLDKWKIERRIILFAPVGLTLVLLFIEAFSNFYRKCSV